MLWIYLPSLMDLKLCSNVPIVDTWIFVTYRYENAGMKVWGWKCEDESARMKVQGWKCKDESAGMKKPRMKMPRMKVWGWKCKDESARMKYLRMKYQRMKNLRMKKPRMKMQGWNCEDEVSCSHYYFLGILLWLLCCVSLADLPHYTI